MEVVEDVYFRFRFWDRLIRNGVLVMVMVVSLHPALPVPSGHCSPMRRQYSKNERPLSFLDVVAVVVEVVIE